MKYSAGSKLSWSLLTSLLVIKLFLDNQKQTLSGGHTGWGNLVGVVVQKAHSSKVWILLTPFQDNSIKVKQTPGCVFSTTVRCTL